MNKIIPVRRFGKAEESYFLFYDLIDCNSLSISRSEPLGSIVASKFSLSSLVIAIPPTSMGVEDQSFTKGEHILSRCSIKAFAPSFRCDEIVVRIIQGIIIIGFDLLINKDTTS